MGSGVNGLRHWKGVVWQPSLFVVQNKLVVWLLWKNNKKTTIKKTTLLLLHSLYHHITTFTEMQVLCFTILFPKLFSLTTFANIAARQYCSQDKQLGSHSAQSAYVVFRLVRWCCGSHASGRDPGAVHRMVLSLLRVW